MQPTPIENMTQQQQLWLRRIDFPAVDDTTIAFLIRNEDGFGRTARNLIFPFVLAVSLSPSSFLPSCLPASGMSIPPPDGIP